MTKELYDQMYRDRKGYTGPVEIFRKAIEWLPLSTFGMEPHLTIVEFGCGIGEFAELLLLTEKALDTDYGQRRIIKSYIGYDISGVAIEHAKKTVTDPRFSFIQCDIENDRLAEIPREAVVVSFQTLEHLSLPNGDRKVIERVPRGGRFMFSVPLNSLGKYHLRLYKGIQHAQRMYKDLLIVRDGLHFKDKHKRILVDSTRI